MAVNVQMGETDETSGALVTDVTKQQGRNWCFRISNPVDDDAPSKWPFKYVVWQVEVSASGLRHLQGYVQFQKTVRFAAVKKMDGSAHWELRGPYSTHEQARAYCMKEETRVAGPWERGTATNGAGQRNDLNAYRDAIKAGMTAKDVVNDDTLNPLLAKYPRYRQAVEMALGLDSRNWMTEVHIEFGVTHSGKSHRARADHPGAFWLPPPREKGVWWDGYHGQETVVIDEFKGWIAQHIFKRLADKYPFQVETKGGMVPFLAKKLIILSNHSPAKWWKDSAGCNALEPSTARRFTTVVEKTVADTYVGDEEPGPTVDYYALYGSASEWPAPAGSDAGNRFASSAYMNYRAEHVQPRRGLNPHKMSTNTNGNDYSLFR